LLAKDIVPSLSPWRTRTRSIGSTMKSN